jgi:Flp pilus assembly CpaE family ATPase
MESILTKEKPAGLAAVLIAQDRDLAQQFYLSVTKTRAFQILEDMKRYPSEQMLGIRLRQFRPAVVLVDLAADPETACSLIRFLASRTPPVTVIGLDHTSRPEVFMRALSLGASEFFTAPFEASAQQDAVARILSLKRPEPAEAAPGRVIAFSSAKPGSGASVVACHAAFSLARLTRKRILLADLDLAGGTVGFYTRVEQSHSFLDVLEQAGEADAGLWSRRVVHSRGVDVLPAPPVPGQIPDDPIRLRQALDRARRSYDWTVLDLPSIFHRVSLLVLAEADCTFLVSTTELPSLHLARKAIHVLAEAGFAPDRFEVVVSQIGRKEGMSRSEIEKILGRAVSTSLPDDHGGLHAAVALGEMLKADGALGEAIDQLAGRLAGVARGGKRKLDFIMDPGPVFAGA